MSSLKPPYPSQAVANSILELAGGALAAKISPMKMQKLVFFAHGWYLGNYGEPLVKDSIQAWQYGPVIESLYHDLKAHGSDFIDSEIMSLSFEEGSIRNEIPRVSSSDTLVFLEQVLDVYGGYSAVQLSNLSHEVGSPWHRVRQEYGDRLNQRSILIPDPLIQDFYSRKLQTGE